MNLQPEISRYFRIKRFVDFPCVFLIALILSPLILFFMLMVRLTSRGPVFYTQIRSGKDGEPFMMYKIRSMVLDAEPDGAVWAMADDPRITKVGRVMRRLHIDELVQLYNVLRGEMALVGPRPERPEFVEMLKDRIPGYEYRLLVPPGMSGFSQLIYPGNTDLDDVRQKLVLDLEYVEDASFWLDMRMLAATFFQFLFIKLSRTVPLRFFGVYRTVEKSRWNGKIDLSRNNIAEQWTSAGLPPAQ